MVVTPQEAAKLNTQKDRAQLANLERIIDKTLREEFEGDPVYVEVEYPRDKVFQEIERKYQAAGWKVKLESDQRDGDYIVFTEAGQ